MRITFISAGAGSGKTTRLMEIIAEAIDKGVPADRIMATTFTVKAAQELKSRIQEKFLKTGDIAKANAASAITIGTINSVCGSLLSLFAFEAGMSPQLSVLDEEAAKVFLNKVIETAIDNKTMHDLDELERRFGIGRSDESKWLEHVQSIINAARASNIDKKLLKDMAKKNADSLLACMGAIIKNPDQVMMDLLDKAIPAIQAFQSQKFQKNTQEYLDLCYQMRQELITHTDSWPLWLKLESKTAGKSCKAWEDQIKDLAAKWKNHPRFHSDIRNYLQIVFDTAEKAMTAFDKEKEISGKLDFTDQEVKLYHLLSNPEVKNRITERMDLLVVDEFQDTSPIQLALFVSLADMAKDTYWVGDVKQSIYGFRGSDSALMEGILTVFQKKGIKIDILPKSYRSCESLVHLANEIFVPAFDDELPPDRIVLEPTRSETPGSSFMHMILDASNKEDRSKQLASGILELCVSGRDVWDKKNASLRKIRYSDIAVLVRTNDDAAAIAAACSELDIPLRTSGQGLMATPEASLVLAVLRRLNDRQDTLASAEILGLTEGLSPQDWLEERINWKENQKPDKDGLWRCEGEKVNPVLSQIEALRPSSRSLSPSALLDTVISRCGLDGFLLSWTPVEHRARQRLANLEAVRALIREYEEEIGEVPTVAGCILWLTENEHELPESPIDGVSILTWHKAKGLEWPVVILQGSEDEIRDVTWKSIRVLKEKTLDLKNPLADSWIRFWPWPFGDLKKLESIDTTTDPDVKELNIRTIKEQRRLLYVGFTRARDLLIIASPTKKAKVNASFTSLGQMQDLFAVPQNGVKTLTLSNGTQVPYECVTVQITAAKATTAVKKIKWFDTAYNPKEYSLARIIPSDKTQAEDKSPATALLSPGKVYTVADPLPRRPGTDMREEGTLYHAAFAFFANNPDWQGPHPYSEEMALSARAMIGELKKLWPDAVLHTELTVYASIENSQFIDARLDLLVETEKGYIIVDHKLSEKSDANTAATILRHQDQLHFYKIAVEAKASKPVLGLYLALPQEGLLIETK